jgi:raffinose/stachyose/melibiose transport system permease protein
MGTIATRWQKPTVTSLRKVVRRILKYWFCYLMLVGTFALLITFEYLPAVSSFYHSFTIWDGFRAPRWAGLQNYQEMFSSPEVRKGVINMIILGVTQMIRIVICPLIAAGMIYRLRSEKWAYFYRLLFVIPIVIPGIVGILVWRQLYEPNVGFFNTLLRALSLPTSAWLNAPNSALFSLIFMGFPWIDGVDVLIILAGLLAIPTEVIEAATVDGASSLRRFFAIELPLIIPQIRLIVILNVIFVIQSFGWQLVVTRGGPNFATTVPAWLIYKEAMLGQRYGMASAIGVAMFVLVFVLTLINNAAIRSNIEYQAQ